VKNVFVFVNNYCVHAVESALPSFCFSPPNGREGPTVLLGSSLSDAQCKFYVRGVHFEFYFVFEWVSSTVECSLEIIAHPNGVVPNGY
jgi:hypothetical protein